MAVSFVLGRNIEDIVVDVEKTAIDRIEVVYYFLCLSQLNHTELNLLVTSVYA